MDEFMRYRVTGALFLFAVAVIVLPMIFDGEGVATVHVDPIEEPIEVPSVPDLADVAPASDYLEDAKVLSEAVDEEGYDTTHGTRLGQPVLTLPSEETAVWAVQTGSFADRDNALQFREQLRKGGFEAFVSTAKTDEGIRHRVAVGPVLDQGEADQLRELISEKFDTTARLMAFST